MNTQRKLLLMVTLLSVLTINACSSINRSDKPATQTWWLEPYNEHTTSSPSAAAKPLVVTLDVVPGLDTHRILTLSDQAELNRFAGQRWPDSLPEFLASLVSRSLENSGKFESGPATRGTGRCELELEVQKFYTVLDSTGQSSAVQVSMRGSYKCDHSGIVLLDLNSTVALTDEGMTGIVAGFQQAMNAIMKDLLDKI